jgi:HK97 family phage portal protein
VRWTPIRRSKREVFPAPPILPNSAYGTNRFAGSVPITQDSALRSSAVWAALRLRANLISSMPVDAFRKVQLPSGKVQVEVKPPQVTWTSGGVELDQAEAIYATQVDLDRSGNTLGVVTERNALGLPTRIELVGLGNWSIRPRRPSLVDKGPIVYVVEGQELDPSDVWHERQYVLPGLAVGLSPVAYAAYSIGGFLSAQRFALDWFGNSAMPAVTLQNTMREIPPDVAEEAKARYQRSTQPGGVFVVGNDWELKPISAAAVQDQYVELMKFGIPDIARFFDVPADLIDGSIPGSSITYANIAQRFTHLNVINIGPAVTRRERAWSKLVPGDRFVKFNRDALLAMDPASRVEMFLQLAQARLRTPSELRELDNLAPFTSEQLAEMIDTWGVPRVKPVDMGGGGGNTSGGAGGEPPANESGNDNQPVKGK